MSSNLSDDDKTDLLLACRYGDLEDVQAFVNQHGASSLSEIWDDNGNSVLHMSSANGHLEVLDYLLPLIPSSLLSAKNNSGSTALHWAALNSQLEVAKKLVQHPGGPGLDLIDIKNNAGHSPLGEAENAGWEEGAKWFVEVMRLEPEGSEQQIDDEATLDMEDGANRDIEVEIEDADGKIAKMTISGNTLNPTATPPTAPSPSS
ncbi:cytoplasmic protein [Pholiota conissans]|uniref:Cytoplasmic protein n=1 Tax=Pholiota conissans TaxID=109636 RepID=A0A9P5ZER7_9AGAR|nr:cytoplasmic protein [Pholiota conissans]